MGTLTFRSLLQAQQVSRKVVLTSSTQVIQLTLDKPIALFISLPSHLCLLTETFHADFALMIHLKIPINRNPRHARSCTNRKELIWQALLNSPTIMNGTMSNQTHRQSLDGEFVGEHSSRNDQMGSVETNQEASQIAENTQLHAKNNYISELLQTN